MKAASLLSEFPGLALQLGSVILKGASEGALC